MALAEVTTLYESSCRDIPAMLRQAANNIENDPECATLAMVAVQLAPDGSVVVYGWGETTTVHAAGLLAIGLQQVASIQLET